MPENLPPGSFDASFDGVNKYGRGAKDKLEDADHNATDGLVNVFGDDQPHLRPGAYHAGEDTPPGVPLMPDVTLGEAKVVHNARALKHCTSSEHDSPPTQITPGRIV